MFFNVLPLLTLYILHTLLHSLSYYCTVFYTLFLTRYNYFIYCSYMLYMYLSIYTINNYYCPYLYTVQYILLYILKHFPIQLKTVYYTLTIPVYLLPYTYSCFLLNPFSTNTYIFMLVFMSSSFYLCHFSF